MKKIICISGGKDSTALMLLSLSYSDCIYIFCDTDWEHPLTYEYLTYLNKTFLDDSLITLKPIKYSGFEDLSLKKKRVPSAMARFCTEALKLEPTKLYIKQFLPDVEIYLGVRADESFKRSLLKEKAFADYYGCYLVRPLLKWTAKDCFDLLNKFDCRPNPLYKKGMKRVGCFPCVLINKKELLNMIRYFPEVKEKIKNLEDKLGRSFFPPNYIPERFQTGYDPKSGKNFPKADDVFDYITRNENQLDLFSDDFSEQSCISYYSICE
ncbi:MAG: phosphoadenosine phosphosulfate reductase family protein [Bacteroidetes bacterium]|nr:phosphoadenosine phosphosulfate reductase family protein [Bacteroidota bacterium]